MACVLSGAACHQSVESLASAEHKHIHVAEQIMCNTVHRDKYTNTFIGNSNRSLKKIIVKNNQKPNKIKHIQKQHTKEIIVMNRQKKN